MMRLMAEVQVRCPSCGNVRTKPRTIRVYIEAGEVRLSCPVCGVKIVQAVGPEVIGLLQQAGARMVEVEGPITEDDLIEFHKNFEDEMRELLR